MSETGPTGSSGPTESITATGLTGPLGPTACTGAVEPDLSMFPSATTGNVEPPHIATLEELMASYEAILSKETVDKGTLSVFTPNSLRQILRPSLFQWAAVGFPVNYIVYSVTIDPPPICSDGVTRSWNDYMTYCMGMTFSDLSTQLQSKVVGIVFSQSTLGNTFRLHVSKE